ncbi:MAG: O-antigen ligase family protein [Burkholderiaceae bacterium]|jgi:O-antigen ligase|nr:O-antigen ligase family protein [Burkholderiaceae bacterium]
MHRLRDWIWRYGASIAAVMTPGLALWLPSGYSWGPVWLLLCALVTVDYWAPAVRGQLRDRRWAALAALFALMGLLWWIDTGPQAGFNNFDIPSKYLLALPCLAYALAAPPRPGALWLGVAVGGIGGGAVALVQRYGLDMDRALGYSNAIQFGDISLLLGLMALTALVLRWRRCPKIGLALLAAGAALGLAGSLLSQSRGGWLALPLAWLAWAIGLWRSKGARAGWSLLAGLTVALALAAGLLAALQRAEVERRIDSAISDVSAYDRHGEADTSVGQRLAHWRVALIMGRERPLLGWGSGYDAEKARLVATGKGSPAILAFDHAHNEWLDMYARRGLTGVTVLAAWFTLPLLIFFPKRRDGKNSAAFAIRMTGLLLPASYLGFGLTQVLLMHNSGHLVYLYGLVIWAGALEGAARPQTPKSGA